jgi:undecaprenyl diphosphate synthase
VQNKLQNGLHVAIIMDGNGRWATARGLPRIAGHRAGVAAVRRTVERAPEIGIATLTVYAFSADNWRRPAREVQAVLSLIAAYLRIESERLRRSGVRLEVIGRRDRLPKLLLREIEKAEWATHAGHQLRLRVAVDYSAREAIVRAAVQACESTTQAGEDCVKEMNRALTRVFENQSADVDLLIRTGGEKRLSDFLLWESAYAELYFTERMWPDFGPDDLDAAIEEFARRERRFGGVPDKSVQLAVLAAGGGR